MPLVSAALEHEDAPWPALAADATRQTAMCARGVRTRSPSHVLVAGVEPTLLPLRYMLLRAVQLRLQLYHACVADACGGCQGRANASAR
jgi:hypothetical protein